MLRGLVGRGDASSQTDGFGSPVKGFSGSKRNPADSDWNDGHSSHMGSLLPARARAWPVPHALRPRSKLALVRFPNTGAMSMSLVRARPHATHWHGETTVRSRDRGITHVSVSLPPAAVSRRWLLKGSAARLPPLRKLQNRPPCTACTGPMGGDVGRRPKTTPTAAPRVHHTGTLEHRRALPSTDRIGRGTGPM